MGIKGLLRRKIRPWRCCSLPLTPFGRPTVGYVAPLHSGHGYITGWIAEGRGMLHIFGMQKRHFASDNYAGSTPEAWAALEEARHGHAPAYGEDEWTERAAKLIRDLFETDCEVFFV